VSVDVVEGHVLPQWQVRVGWDDSWQVMWSHVADQLSVPQNYGKKWKIDRVLRIGRANWWMEFQE